MTMSSYPLPEVEWHLNNSTVILQPDQTSNDGNYLCRDGISPHHRDNTGKYSAELVKTVGENQYLINLLIRNVSLADGGSDHFLRVTVKEREFTVPVIVETQKEWGEVTSHILN